MEPPVATPSLSDWYSGNAGSGPRFAATRPSEARWFAIQRCTFGGRSLGGRPCVKPDNALTQPQVQSPRP